MKVCSSTNCKMIESCHRAQSQLNRLDKENWVNFEEKCNDLNDYIEYIPINKREKLDTLLKK